VLREQQWSGTAASVPWQQGTLPAAESDARAGTPRLNHYPPPTLAGHAQNTNPFASRALVITTASPQLQLP